MENKEIKILISGCKETNPRYFQILTMVIENLRTQADEIEKVVAFLERAIASLRAAADALESLSHLGSPNVSDVPNGSVNANGHAIGNASMASPVLPGIRSIESVLRSAGERMTVEDISAKLKELGHPLEMSTLQSYLSKDKRFLRVGKGVWSLRSQADLELAPVDRDPETLP